MKNLIWVAIFISLVNIFFGLTIPPSLIDFDNMEKLDWLLILICFVNIGIGIYLMMKVLKK